MSSVMNTLEVVKVLVEMGARALGQTVSQFVKSIVLGQSRRVIREETVTSLSMRDWDKVQELLTNPPTPNKALREAMELHRESVRSDV